MLEQMAKDGAEMKIKVKALEAFVTPGADPWQPGLAPGSSSRPAEAGGRPAAPPGVEPLSATTAAAAPLREPHRKDMTGP